MGGCAVLMVAAGAIAHAQTVPVAAPAPGLIETGVPAFVVSSAESLGLRMAPRDLLRLPDGRFVAVGRGEIAVGDGVRWEVSQQRGNEPVHEGGAMAADADGTLYAGAPGVLARVRFGDDGRWTLDPVAPLPGEFEAERRVLAFLGAVGGAWYWGWSSGPVVSWRPGQNARVVGQGSAIRRVFELDGAAHCTDESTGQLFRFDGTAFVAQPRPASAFVEDAVTASARADDGAWLVATIARGVLRRAADGRLMRLAETGVLAGGHKINDLCALPGGTFAAAVDNVGVVFFEPSGRIVQWLGRRVDHRLVRAQRLVVAPGGTVWARLTDGLVRIRFPSRISYYEPLVPSGLAFAQPFRRDGRLWLMADGLAQRGEYDEGGRLVGFEIDSPPGYVGTLAEIDGIWLASTTLGLYAWRVAGRWEPLVDGVNTAYVRGEPLADGRWLYVADNEVGWLRRSGAGFTAERHPVDGLGHAFGAVADRHGILWAELGVGRVARIEPTASRPYVEVYGRDDGLGDAWAQVFLVDGEARINSPPQILAFDAAARRWTVDTEIVGRMPGLAGVVGRPVIDARGRLWVSGDGGVRVGPPGSVGAVDPTVPAELRPIHITPQDDGIMWLHEPTRLARYDPTFPEAEAEPLRALITRVDFAGSGRALHMPSGRLPAAAAADNAFTVHFLAPGVRPGSTVTFSVLLEGAAQAEWLPAGAGGHLSYTGLAPGDYRLRIRPEVAGTAGGEAVLDFAVRAPWHRTTAAYVGYALTGIAVLGLAIGLERGAKRRLERLVAERTDALHRAKAELERQIEREYVEVERRRRVEADLYQAQKLESVGTLAGGIAHDFNNILTGILGCCELATIAARSGQAVDGELAEIRAAGLRAKDLIARILTFSRRAEPRLAPVDLATVVGEALRMMRAVSPASIEIVSALAPGRVRADATQIHQVVVNLCTNAVHAMGSGPGRLEVRIDPVPVEGELARSMPELEAGPCMRLTIVDTGVGMDAATLARIFDPFFTTKAPGQGTGLGLPIVRGIMENHGGALRVHSEVGRGTRVEAYLPATVEDVDPRAGPDAAFIVCGRLREIMVVDDEPAVAKFVAARLRQLDFRTQVFLEPVAARDAFRQAPARFAAVVTDLTMPQITGMDLIAAIREVAPLVPVVIISGYSPELAGLGDGRLPHAAVLTKPFSGEELGRALARLLGDD